MLRTAHEQPRAFQRMQSRCHRPNPAFKSTGHAFGAPIPRMERSARLNFRRFRASRTVSPVARTSACVSDCDDVDVFVANAVDHAVRKSVNVELTAGATSAARRTNFWLRPNKFNRRRYGIEELSTEADATLFVLPDGRGQLLRGGIAEMDRLHRPRMSFSIRRFTDSQGSRPISPDSIA